MLKVGVLCLALVVAVAASNNILSEKVDPTNPLFKGCFLPDYLVDIDAPVCANNGVTYRNNYILECISNKYPNVKPTRYGKCTDTESKKSICPCPKFFSPICGSDGQTYDNKCLLECQAKLMMADIKINHSGPCQKTS